MTRKHFIVMATAMGNGLGAAYLHGGEEGRTAFYDEVYTPLVALCRESNPAFDSLRFSHAASVQETHFLAAHPASV